MQRETTSQIVCKYVVLKGKDLLWLAKILRCTITDCKKQINTNCWRIKSLHILITKGIIK